MGQRPEFTIIAGPNGAGKSRLCSFYANTSSFDGDKLMLNLRREHPDWPDSWISGTVASELEKQKDEALQQKNSFAFETNFSSEMVLYMIHDFRKAGFIDGNSEYGKIIALHISKSQIHKVIDNPPLWFKEQFEVIFKAL